MARTIAVTGASGSLGRLVVARLLGEPDVERVVTIDRVAFPTPHEKLVSVVRDVRDAALGRDLAGCDALVHLAFVVERGSRDDAAVRSINRDGTRNVVERAVEAGARAVVYASSIAAYGFHRDNAGRLLTESDPLRGNESFYYARDKAWVERWLEEHAAARPDVAIARLRPSLFLGPRMDRRRKALIDAPVLLSLGAASTPLHLTHEDDVADAFVLAVRARASGAFNVATADPLPLRDWSRLTGKPLVRVPHAVGALVAAAYRLGLGDVDPDWFRMAGELPLLVSAEKIRRELGWAPRLPTTASVVEEIASSPTARASRATKLVFGPAALVTKLAGSLPMSERDRAEARGMKGSLNVVLTGAHPSRWHVRVEDGKVGVYPGTHPDARGTATLTEDAFLDMLSGKLQTMRAQTTGKVRFRGAGEMMFLLGVAVQQFQMARRARGWPGLPARAYTRLVLRAAGRAPVEDASEKPDKGAAA